MPKIIAPWNTKIAFQLRNAHVILRNGLILTEKKLKNCEYNKILNLMVSTHVHLKYSNSLSAYSYIFVFNWNFLHARIQITFFCWAYKWALMITALSAPSKLNPKIHRQNLMGICARTSPPPTKATYNSWMCHPANEKNQKDDDDEEREEKIWSKSFNCPGCWFGCGSSDLQFAPIHHSVTFMALFSAAAVANCATPLLRSVVVCIFKQP
jgi:hypothetical protein